MSGREKIKQGIEQSDALAPPSLTRRVEQLETKSREAYLTAGDAYEETKRLDSRLEKVEEADRRRAKHSRSLVQIERTAAAFFALASVVTLLTLKVSGLVAISLPTVFLPALAVPLVLAAIRFFNDRGYNMVHTAIEIAGIVILTALVAAIAIPIAVLFLLGALVKPARNWISKRFDDVKARLQRAENRVKTRNVASEATA